MTLGQTLPPALKRKIRRLVALAGYRRRLQDASLENVPLNASVFAYKYQLWTGSYFSNYKSWKQNRRAIAGDERMSLQHHAMVDFLKNNPLPETARFIDVCCGLGHLFVYLKALLNYSDFTGVEDSGFQPGIVAAARDFLNYYSVPATLADFNVAFASNYSSSGFYGQYDVFPHFGVDTYYFYPIAYKVLKPGGFYIAELEDPNPGIYQDCFEVIKTYPDHGRRGDTGVHPYGVTILRKTGAIL
jgi:SAM-dependent methyltransferase